MVRITHAIDDYHTVMYGSITLSEATGSCAHDNIDECTEKIVLIENTHKFYLGTSCFLGKYQKE